jgi:hypothetical protein
LSRVKILAQQNISPLFTSNKAPSAISTKTVQRIVFLDIFTQQVFSAVCIRQFYRTPPDVIYDHYLFKPSQFGYKDPLNNSCSAPEKGSQRPSNKEFRFRQGKNPGINSLPGTTKSMDLYVRFIPTCVRLLLRSENVCGVTGKVDDGREKPECFTRGPS